jgi:hypothetical protein
MLYIVYLVISPTLQLHSTPPIYLMMMNLYNAAPWSSPSSPDNSRYRTTHHNQTKQRGNQEQKVLDSWTWEEILDGKGPWAQAGEYRLPKEVLEAVKAERRRHEVRQRNRHKRGVAHGEIGGVRR